MVPARALTVAALALATALACSNGGGADPEAFCDRYDRLADLDPFGELDVALTDEIEAAYVGLRDAAAELRAVAPAEAEAAAGDYVEAIDEMIGLLDEAGFDLRRLDTLAFGGAVDDYYDAAVLLDRAAGATCT